MDNPKELTHISLCAGYGGIDLGLKRAIGDVRTVCYVEIENFVIDNLVKKIEANLIDNCPVYTNLKIFPWELFSGRVDILSGGFPCQPFSAAGRRKGSEDPRHLWPYITDGIKRLGRPAIVYFENVEGIISSKLKGDDWADPKGTPVLLHVLRELERLGYKATASVFSASEVGAPHRRKRVFILGVRNDLAETGISLIDELIRRNDSDFELGYTKSEQDEFRKLRDLEETERGGQSYFNAIRSTSRSTAWPASRGQKQHWYEPPRVTMGNSDGKRLERVKQKNKSSTKVQCFTSHACRRQLAELGNSKHDGSLDSKESRNANETGYDNTQGQESAIKSERASRPRGYGSLQTSELEYSDGGRDVSHGIEFRILHSETECREAGGLERTGDVTELDNSDSQRLLRDRVESTDTESQRWQESNGHYAEADTSSRELHGEIESSLGGNAYGVADRLDYAELYESCDNRTDELRMLGNGVVPDTATRAFSVLWRELVNSTK